MPQKKVDRANGATWDDRPEYRPPPGWRARPGSDARQLWVKGWRRCIWCGEPVTKNETAEHMLPQTLGGRRDEGRNLALAHFDCNTRRGHDLSYAPHPEVYAWALGRGLMNPFASREPSRPLPSAEEWRADRLARRQEKTGPRDRDRKAAKTKELASGEQLMKMDAAERWRVIMKEKTREIEARLYQAPPPEGRPITGEPE